MNGYLIGTVVKWVDYGSFVLFEISFVDELRCGQGKVMNE